MKLNRYSNEGCDGMVNQGHDGDGDWVRGEDADQAIERLRKALESLKQYTVCNCPENEHGEVKYHFNCHKSGRRIIDEALNQ